MNGKIYSKYDFAGRLKDRRTACGITSCEKLAKIIFPDGNLDSMRKKVERWEKGLCEPTISEFYKLCTALDCDPEYLWGVMDVPRRYTRTVMEITRLDEDAVDMLVKFNGIVTDTRFQALKPSHVISLILKNPSFYEVIREINSSTNHQMLLEKTRLERRLVAPDKKDEYDKEMSELEEVAKRMGNLVNEYGYDIVPISELLKISEFRINQSLGVVVQETINLLHDEAKAFIYQLLDEAQKNCTKVGEQ